jgi:sacsin
VLQEGPQDPAVDGQAYCFLPLPVMTRLPVHVNGYFELSSNRRDIWYGDDMIGDGRMRAEWNRSLLRDIIAVAYVRLLSLATEQCGPGPTYDGLWPVQAGSLPWQELLDQVHAACKTLPLLHSDLGGGVWINTQDAVLLPLRATDGQEEDTTIPRLSTILQEEGLPVVRCPLALQEVLVAKKSVERVANPDFIRKHFRQEGEGGKQPPMVAHPSLRERANVCLLLKYCVEDVGESNLAVLQGLPFLPVASSEVRTIQLYRVSEGPALEQLRSMGFSLGTALKALSRVPPAANGSAEGAIGWVVENQGPAEARGEAFGLGELVLTCGDPEVLQLFQAVAGRVLSTADLDPRVLALFQTRRFQTTSNVRPLDTSMLPTVLRYVLPCSFRDEAVVAWAEDGSMGPGLPWFLDLWRYVLTQLQDLGALADGLSLLPCNENKVCRLSVRVPVALRSASIPEAMLVGLRRVGVLTVHDTLVERLGPAATKGLAPFVRQPTRAGILHCLGLIHEVSTRPGKPLEGHLPAVMGKEMSPESRDALRGFLVREPLVELTTDQAALVRFLPIFRTFAPEPTFVALTTKPLYLLDVPMEKLPEFEAILTPQFLRPMEALEVPLLRLLGATVVTKAEFFIWHFFPRYASTPPAVRKRAMLDLVLTDLPGLVHTDVNFAAVMGDLAFLPSLAGPTMLRCQDAYDPEVDELVRLVGRESFPDEDFSRPEVLVYLRQLGLRSTLTYEDVVRIARSVEVCTESDAPEGVARARNLFTFLNMNTERFFVPINTQPEPAKNKGGAGANFLTRALQRVRTLGSQGGALHSPGL